MGDAGNRRTIAPARLAIGFEPGKRVKLKLGDGTEVTGKYLGLVPLPPEDYAARYGTARASLKKLALLPLPGDTVTVLLVSGADWSGAFRGFDFDGVVIEDGRGMVATRSTQILELTMPSSASISGATLGFLIAERRVPFRSGIGIELAPRRRGSRPATRITLPVDNIVSIEIRPTSGKKVGAIVGGVLDIAVLAALAICGASAQGATWGPC